MTLASALPAAAPGDAAAPNSGDEPVSILLVDDQPQNLLVLETLLEDLGQNLVRARSGPEALRQLLQRDFAVIVMDVNMPGMDGLEVASLIRARERTRHTPIIFVTAYEDADRLLRGYELGAIDYLIKPIAPAILRSKVAVLVDLYQMNRKVQRQTEQLRDLERQRYERDLAAARERWEMERLRADALAGRQVQERLFPIDRMPLPMFDIGGGSFPAAATGGDYFDYIPLIDDSVGVVIGDVSGHGFGPALLMAAIRAYLRALTLTRTDIGEIVGLLNRALHGDVPEGRFATLLVGRLDGQRRTFAYASAGHPPGYLLDAAGRVKQRLESTGLPLAILPDEAYAATDPIPLEAGDVIVLVTDGILEAAGDDGLAFGTQRVLDLVRARQHEPARQVVRALYQAVRDHCGQQDQPDDMTAIIIKMVPEPATGGGAGTGQALADTLPDFAMPVA
jgi:serine phosphatase RsbU (regulator of sigma subunit)